MQNIKLFISREKKTWFSVFQEQTKQERTCTPTGEHGSLIANRRNKNTKTQADLFS